MGARSIPADQAVEELRGCGFAPLEPYPGKASALWRVECLGCGQPRRLRLTQARAGRRCAHTASPRPTWGEAAAELARFRLELVGGWDGLVRTVLTLRCGFCGERKRISLADVRAGRRCGHRVSGRLEVTPEEAVEEMRGYGYEPLEPYPGKAAARWHHRCLEPGCGRERVVSLSHARAGRRCAHRASRRG